MKKLVNQSFEKKEGRNLKFSVRENEKFLFLLYKIRKKSDFTVLLLSVMVSFVNGNILL